MAKRRYGARRKVRRVRRRVPMRARPSRFTRRRMRYGRTRRTAYLRVKRIGMSTGTSQLGNATVGGFWRYVAPSLDAGWANPVNGTVTNVFNNIAEFENLFEQYKLHGVKYTFMPTFQNAGTQINSGAAPTSNFKIPYVAVQFDPQSTLTPSGLWTQANLNNLLEGGAKVYRFDRPFSIYLKPRVSEQYGSGATRYVTPKFTTLDPTGKSMLHRGMHMFFFNNEWDSTSLGLTKFEVKTTYYVTFKNMK